VLCRLGFATHGVRTQQDSSGDVWISLLMARA